MAYLLWMLTRGKRYVHTDRMPAPAPEVVAATTR
jgi:hypothetical protein